MQLRWLGWAGVELEVDGETLVIDALADPAAVFEAFTSRGMAVELPEVAPPRAGTAVAALVTHLHRDHTDAGAIEAALRPGAPVLEPPRVADARAPERLGIVQADHDLTAAGLERREVAPWETVGLGPFTITAVPAVDGLGDPQTSWAVEAGGVRVLHLGDTLFHGSWWEIAQRCGPFDVVLLPVNAAVVTFPHRRPASTLPATMGPEQAAAAAEAVGARLAIPIHAEGYRVQGYYEPVEHAARAFAEEAASRAIEALVPALGEPVELPAAVTA